MEHSEEFRTVLVATDFSESADGAIEWAAELARPHGAKLVLVHASMPLMPVVAAPEFVPLPPAAYEADRERVQIELGARTDVLREKGLEVVSQARSGPPVEVILDAAESEAADLIVVGTRGLTGAKRIFLGSTAAQVVRRAPCPVLTVHPDQATTHRPIRTIVVPTDGSDDAKLAVREAVRLLGPVSANARLKLLHVYRLQPEVVYPWTPAHMAFRATEAVAEAMKQLEEVAGPLRKQGFDVELLVDQGYPPDVIDDVAKRSGADLIAMGTHGRSFLPRLVLGSVAERVLPEAPCPVLTVHHAVSESTITSRTAASPSVGEGATDSSC